MPERKLQLIEATIDVLAHKSFSSLTTADVARQAGVSSGTVFTYFETKQELFRETLIAMEQAYVKHLEAEGFFSTSGRERILALLRTELSDELASPRMLRAWIAFRSEMREIYKEVAEHATRVEDDMLKASFVELDRAEGAYKYEIFRATVDGLLRTLQLDNASRDEARRIAGNCLHYLLPQQFSELP